MIPRPPDFYVPVILEKHNNCLQYPKLNTIHTCRYPIPRNNAPAPERETAFCRRL